MFECIFSQFPKVFSKNVLHLSRCVGKSILLPNVGENDLAIKSHEALDRSALHFVNTKIDLFGVMKRL